MKQNGQTKSDQTSTRTGVEVIGEARVLIALK